MSLRPPGGRKPKVVIQFRADAENADWAQKFVAKGHEDGPTQSVVVDWLFRLGRLQYEALHRYDSEIEAVKKEGGFSDAEAIRHVFELGLTAWRKNRK